MSRPSKGARLYPQRERRDPVTNELLERAVWVVRDGSVKRSTGVPVTDDRRAPPEAEQALSRYLAEKHTPPRDGHRPLSAIPVADVINIYLTDCAERQARPIEVGQRATALVSFWGNRTLAQVNGESCRAYVAQGGTRRQLEDLRSAINHHLKEGHHREIVGVVLPEKGEPRERWLTRDEAARLIWAAWRFREGQEIKAGEPRRVSDGKLKGRAARQHVARFVLVGLYTGTRAGAVCAAAFEPTKGKGWVDLKSGVFYRRPAGERQTKKQKTPMRLPDRLVAHLTRWKDKGICRNHPVEWNGEAVSDVDKAFRNARIDAGLSADVTPHILKHTAVTWAMQNGMSKEDAASFFATTVETIERVYWHHHPDFQKEAASKVGVRSRQKPDRNGRNDREQNASGGSNVVKFG